MANLCNKINNRGDVTEVGRKIVKIRSPVDRVRVRARVRLGLVPHSVSSGKSFLSNCMQH